MKTFLLILILAFVGVSNGSAHKQSVNERIMRGTWLLEGGGEKNTPRWYIEWTFDDKGKFSINGYPQMHQEGSYRVVRTNDKDNALTLELFDQKGDLDTKNILIGVRVDPRPDTLMIKARGPFRRVIAKQGSY